MKPRGVIHAFVWGLALSAMFAANASAGFINRMVRIGSGGIDTQINTAEEAVDILDHNYFPGQYQILEDETSTTSAVNFGPGGDFGGDLAYPNGETTSALSDFAVRSTATLTIPAGTWTIGFGSDDGGFVTLLGVLFSSEFNTVGDVGLDDTILYDQPRGFEWTLGVFTLGAETTVDLEAVFFERTGGDAFELAIASGSQSTFSTSAFNVLTNGQNGWGVAVPEPSTGALLGLGLAAVAAARRRSRG